MPGCVSGERRRGECTGASRQGSEGRRKGAVRGAASPQTHRSDEVLLAGLFTGL